jgi:long-chain fatty acid transport protein
MLPNTDASAKITLPSTAFAGISFKPVNNLDIEFDYQYVGWSTYDTLAVDFVNPAVARSADPKLYKDTYILRFGGEYTMGDLQLRAGYYFDRTPVPDETLEPLLPDSDRNGFNIGAGYYLTKNIHADISYMFLKGSQRKATNTLSNINGTYNTYVNLLGINFGYNF